MFRSGSSEPNLDDFELISEEELEKESQNEFLGRSNFIFRFQKEYIWLVFAGGGFSFILKDLGMQEN